MTPTEQGYAMLVEIRKELGLDKEIEHPDERPTPRYFPPHISKARSWHWKPKAERKPRTDYKAEERRPRPGEVQLKAWIAAKAKAEGSKLGMTWRRYFQGQYGIKVRRVTRWLQYVQTQ